MADRIGGADPRFQSYMVACYPLVRWVEPFVDTRQWEYYDLSCVNRDKFDRRACSREIHTPHN